MKKSLTSLLALFLCAAMVLGNAAVCSADFPRLIYEWAQGSILFNPENGYIIEWKGNSDITHVTLPEEIAGIKVTAISGAFYRCKDLMSIEIPSGVTLIGYYAFYECENLESIVLPEGLTEIGDGVFEYCKSLRNINIPKSVTVIKRRVFKACESLESISIPEGVTIIWYGTFDECKSLKSVELPESLEEIGAEAFKSCESLTAITIPKNVTKIWTEAFLNCPALEKIEVDSDNPAYVSKDGILFNKDMTELVRYPSGIKNTDYTVPYGVKRIAENAFSGNDSLVKITLPDTVNEIGSYAFSECRKLESVKMPGNITSFGAAVFQNTAYYEDEKNWVGGLLYAGKYLVDSRPVRTVGEIKINAGTVGIAKEALAGCDKMTALQLPESLRYIGILAFSSCKSLGEVKFPDRLISIGDNAFSGCNALRKISIPDSVCYIGKSAFDCDSLSEVVIGKGAETIGDQAFKSKNLKSITVSEKNAAYKSEDGVFFDKSMTKLIKYPPESDRKSYIVPVSVTEICESAFSGCKNLTEVELGENLEIIGDHAFVNSALTRIDIPGRVTTIGSSAFSGCSDLKEATLGDSVTKIDGWLFSSCKSLESVTLGRGLTSLGIAPFSGCDSLCDIYYRGTAEEWANIKNIDMVDPKNVTVHYENQSD